MRDVRHAPAASGERERASDETLASDGRARRGRRRARDGDGDGDDGAREGRGDGAQGARGDAVRSRDHAKTRSADGPGDADGVD